LLFATTVNSNVNQPKRFNVKKKNKIKLDFFLGIFERNVNFKSIMIEMEKERERE